MKIKMVARQKIRVPETGDMHDDFGLRALNGYYESKIIDVSEKYNPIEAFDELYADIEGRVELKGEWDFEIKTIVE